MDNKQVLLYGIIALAGCILMIIFNWRFFRKPVKKDVDIATEKNEEATFDIHNHEDTPLHIQAEPDGAVFILPPGGVAKVTYCSLGKGVALTFGVTSAGVRHVTLLDDGGGYWVEYDDETVLI